MGAVRPPRPHLSQPTNMERCTKVSRHSFARSARWTYLNKPHWELFICELCGYQVNVLPKVVRKSVFMPPKSLHGANSKRKSKPE